MGSGGLRHGRFLHGRGEVLGVELGAFFSVFTATGFGGGATAPPGSSSLGECPLTQHLERLGVGAPFDLFDEGEEVVETVLVAFNSTFTAGAFGFVGGCFVEGGDGEGGLFERCEEHRGGGLFGVVSGGGVAAGESGREGG